MLLTLALSSVPAHAQSFSETLVTEPDQGFVSIYNLISSAISTIDMTMYELDDTQAEQLLAQAAARGVRVRVILDQNREKTSNTSAYNYLSSNGVEVHWANPAYAATHQKTITVDMATTAIMTLNLTSQYYSTTRDFAVIENDSNDVTAIEATFESDFNNSAITPLDADNLVWSPTNSQSVILNVINSAKHSLQVENEEMGDTAVTNALASAASRGVLVQIVMTNDSDEYSEEFNRLVAAGAEVSTYPSTAPFYIHAKVILADYGGAGAQAFIGSENFSSASLTENRELGLVLSDAAILQSLDGTLTSDFNGGQQWPGSPSPTASVVNAASFQPGFGSGAWVTILGTSLAPLTDSWTNFVVDGRLPTSLDGVTVTMGGESAYVQYVSPTQINAVAPNLAAGVVSVTVSSPNGARTVVPAVASTLQPAFFQWGAYAVATHQDYSYAVKNGTFSMNTVPAAPGDVIILWGTGFGATDPAAPEGMLTPSDRTYNTAGAVAVTLGDTPTTVYSAALAPGFAALYQVAIQIPESLPDGDYAVVATISGAQSALNVLLTVMK